MPPILRPIIYEKFSIAFIYRGHSRILQSHDPSDASTYTTQTGAPNQLNIMLNVTGKIGGSLHNHPVNALDRDGNPIPADPLPTGDDVAALYTLYHGNAMSDPSTFVLGVVTPDDVWNLQISDVTAFSTWAATNLSTTAQVDAFKIKLENAQFDYWNNQNKSTEDAHELGLLDLLAGSGISLSKASLDLNTWTKESNSSGTITSTPCN
jgi:hypothetical protein